MDAFLRGLRDVCERHIASLVKTGMESEIEFFIRKGHSIGIDHFAMGIQSAEEREGVGSRTIFGTIVSVSVEIRTFFTRQPNNSGSIQYFAFIFFHIRGTSSQISSPNGVGSVGIIEGDVISSGLDIRGNGLQFG